MKNTEHTANTYLFSIYRKGALALSALFLCAASYASVDQETQAHRLLKPSFQELQSEFVFQQVHTYRCADAALIEKALDNQFERIEFMQFLGCEEEPCQ